MVHFNSDGTAIDVKVKPLSPLLGKTIPFPRRQTDGSAGVDLRACVPSTVTVSPGETELIGTGLAVALPGPGVVGLVFARSGLAAKHGIALANGVGVIDSDYRGEIMVALVNNGNRPFPVETGDRIAQMVFMPVLNPRLHVVDDLDDTARGGGGFGHTGVD